MSELRKLINKSFDKQLGEISPNLQRSAMDAYREISNRLRNVPISGNKLMTMNKERLRTRINPINLGKLCLFYYWPKLRDKLPYYDRFPLVMPIQIYPDGFLGINFHYLPPRYRALLLDMIDTHISKKKWLSDKTMIRMTYSVLKSAIRIPIYKPCIKRYLYSHLRSRFYMLEPENWNLALFLPLERFDKAPMSRVHTDSLREIRKFGAIRH